MRITVNPPKSKWAELLRRPQIDAPVIGERVRSEEHTSELQSR